MPSKRLLFYFAAVLPAGRQRRLNQLGAVQHQQLLVIVELTWPVVLAPQVLAAAPAPTVSAPPSVVELGDEVPFLLFSLHFLAGQRQRTIDVRLASLLTLCASALARRARRKRLARCTACGQCGLPIGFLCRARRAKWALRAYDVYSSMPSAGLLLYSAATSSQTAGNVGSILSAQSSINSSSSSSSSPGFWRANASRLSMYALLKASPRRRRCRSADGDAGSAAAAAAPGVVLCYRCFCCCTWGCRRICYN
ncbi:hypothetical protein PsorP6_002340 [Peronosclerospora sorghi]|uniref:Uncharacterized protein n=1 Tax=Peronosclerospora sorghi TaxID=230839 RepID=A0ACC0WT60_9STRA|nr:hypothetical protein PsorP6_002340 [Peronosclerospora sorghi]